MIDAIKNFFTETVGPYWSVFFCSMLPIIELRGAIPMGAALGLPWWQNYLLSVAGNMLPVPFILLFIEKIIQWMAASKVNFFQKLAGWVNRKAEKNRPRKCWNLFHLKSRSQKIPLRHLSGTVLMTAVFRRKIPLIL